MDARAGPRAAPNPVRGAPALLTLYCGPQATRLVRFFSYQHTNNRSDDECSAEQGRDAELFAEYRPPQDYSDNGVHERVGRNQLRWHSLQQPDVGGEGHDA